LIYVLVHSPIVGPATWVPVASELEALGHKVLVPDLHTPEGGDGSFWHRHAQAVAEEIRSLPADVELVLAAHSGGGLLLPAIRRALDRGVAAYCFVDAGIPEDGASRLDLLRKEMPTAAEETARVLESGRRVPAWTDESLRRALPDPAHRSAVLAEMHPQEHDYYSEPIPVSAGWPDAPSCYLQFSPSYDMYAERARREGWEFSLMAAGHFHMLVEPRAVAREIVRLVESALAQRVGVP
jgi:hypothetical protein